MNDFYTFILTSTINSVAGAIDAPTRFNQTLETIDSIYQKVPNSKILFIDNSIISLSSKQQILIKSKVDQFEQLEHNLFSYFFNERGLKSPSEAYLMECAIKLLKKYELIGKRIFKMTGRYKLTDSFNIEEYNDPKYQGKYAFRITQWDFTTDNWNTSRREYFFETRVWSLCPTLLDEYTALLQPMLNFMLEKNENTEIAHYRFIPHDKVIELKTAHLEGIMAGGDYRSE